MKIANEQNKDFSAMLAERQRHADFTDPITAGIFVAVCSMGKRAKERR